VTSGSPGLRPNPDAIATRLGDEIVLVHLGTDRIYSLNPTGARIWELACDLADRAEIARRLLVEFDVTPGEVEAAVDEILVALTESGLLVRSP
jgi:hypothetical protein